MRANVPTPGSWDEYIGNNTREAQPGWWSKWAYQRCQDVCRCFRVQGASLHRSFSLCSHLSQADVLPQITNLLLKKQIAGCKRETLIVKQSTCREDGLAVAGLQKPRSASSSWLLVFSSVTTLNTPPLHHHCRQDCSEIFYLWGMVSA